MAKPRKTSSPAWGERPACPDPHLHHPEPPSSLGWWEWAEKMMVDHIQLRCPACGLWSVIIRRDTLPDLPCILCTRTDGIDWAEQTFPDQTPPGRMIPLCPAHWNDGWELDNPPPPFSDDLPPSTAAYPPVTDAKSPQVGDAQ
jgi:hypothetical protein